MRQSESGGFPPKASQNTNTRLAARRTALHCDQGSDRHALTASRQGNASICAASGPSQTHCALASGKPTPVCALAAKPVHQRCAPFRRATRSITRLRAGTGRRGASICLVSPACEHRGIARAFLAMGQSPRAPLRRPCAVSCYPLLYSLEESASL